MFFFKNPARLIRTHGMGAGRPLSHFIQFFQRFHLSSFLNKKTLLCKSSRKDSEKLQNRALSFISGRADLGHLPLFSFLIAAPYCQNGLIGGRARGNPVLLIRGMHNLPAPKINGHMAGVTDNISRLRF